MTEFKEVVIGPCTLVCADSLLYLSTTSSASCDCVLTDPPYGHNNNNNGDLIHKREAALGHDKRCVKDSSARAIANDGQEANEIFRMILPELFRILSPGCCCCCSGGGGGPDPQFARWSLWMGEVFDFKQMVVWDKGPMGMGWHYRRSYETVLVAQVPGKNCKWFDKSNSVENIIRPGYRGIKKIIPSKEDHPIPKPWELAAHFLRLHTQEGDLVLDPFMGHGWVGEACIRLGRRFLGIEIDPIFFEKACSRLRCISMEKRSELPIDVPSVVDSSLW